MVVVVEEEAVGRRCGLLELESFIHASYPSSPSPPLSLSPSPPSLSLSLSSLPPHILCSMVLLSLHSASGNTGSRYFAYSGHLALTPCTIHGCSYPLSHFSSPKFINTPPPSRQGQKRGGYQTSRSQNSHSGCQVLRVSIRSRQCHRHQYCR